MTTIYPQEKLKFNEWINYIHTLAQNGGKDFSPNRQRDRESLYNEARGQADGSDSSTRNKSGVFGENR